MPTFLVTEVHDGQEWDPVLPLHEQSGFVEHAAFMDALVAEGVVKLGGPLATCSRHAGRRPAFDPGEQPFDAWTVATNGSSLGPRRLPIHI